ncbi:MAG: hypothetical protein E7320_03235 [Clostridiales bacterium]|nr:hypothetical protein [Clostridiales bacterium]
MKVRKRLGNVFTCLGGITLFIGLIAYILPRTENRQLKLVTESFRTPTNNLLLQGMNSGMSAAMDNSLAVLVIGLVLVLLGILLICSVRTAPVAKVQRSRQPVYVPVQAAPAAAAAQANPFARAQAAQPNESNPFVRYIDPDAIPKSTTVRGAAPIAEEDPFEEPDDAFGTLIDTEPEAELLPVVVPGGEQQIDGEYYYPLQTDEEDVGTAQEEADEIAAAPEEETDAPAEEPEEAPEGEETFFLPMEDDDEPAPEAEAELPAEEAEAAADPADPGEEVPEAPAPEEQQAPQVPLYAAATDPALRPVIRSTFKKSTDRQSADGQTDGAKDGKGGLQPVSRIKSTIGLKR